MCFQLLVFHSKKIQMENIRSLVDFFPLPKSVHKTQTLVADCLLPCILQRRQINEIGWPTTNGLESHYMPYFLAIRYLCTHLKNGDLLFLIQIKNF